MNKKSNQGYKQKKRQSNKGQSENIIPNTNLYNSSSKNASREGYGDGDPHGYSKKNK